ncbi:MAG TPA: IS110 family transposase [Gammaproteobacteria bacterium]|nr:IS110 family transposase [Gammaproteobacteria bacterium]
MKLTRVGIDLAKNVFQVHGVDEHGKLVWKRQLKRATWLQVLLDRAEPSCVIGMEACGGAHHWARELQSRGYTVKLIPAQFVKPYVKSQKNDAKDAEAICEAMSRPGMRFVSVKTVEQQDIQSIHRVRSLLMSERTAKANQIRGLVAEYGLVAPQHMSPLRQAIPGWLEDAENGLTDRFRSWLHELWNELLRLDQRRKALDAEIKRISDTHPGAKRLKQLRGVGPLVATALVARFGDGRHFQRGRQAAASVGLTPRHHGTGGKNRLYGITKQGDRYLRSILIHGARAVVWQSKRRDDRLSLWLTELAARSHPNVAAVALANKTVRIAWVMLRHGTDFDPELAVA